MEGARKLMCLGFIVEHAEAKNTKDLRETFPQPQLLEVSEASIRHKLGALGTMRSKGKASVDGSSEELR